MKDTELRALADAADARFKALSPSQKLRAIYMQKRSFARGMGSSKTPHDVHCANVDKFMPDEKSLTDTEIGLILAGQAAPTTKTDQGAGR